MFASAQRMCGTITGLFFFYCILSHTFSIRSSSIPAASSAGASRERAAHLLWCAIRIRDDGSQQVHRIILCCIPRYKLLDSSTERTPTLESGRCESLSEIVLLRPSDGSHLTLPQIFTEQFMVGVVKLDILLRHSLVPNTREFGDVCCLLERHTGANLLRVIAY